MLSGNSRKDKFTPNSFSVIKKPPHKETASFYSGS